MSIEKSKLKMMVANNLGADIEDGLEGQLKAAHELDGAAESLKQVAKKVPADLAAKVDQDLDGGNIKDGMTPSQVAQYAKQYLTRVGDYLAHLSDVQRQKAITQFGRVDGMKDAMKIVQQMHDSESAKIVALSKLGEESLVQPRTASESARREHGSAADRKAAAGKAVKNTPKKKAAKKAPRKKAAKKVAAKAK
jgi:hypothetical protein